MTASFHQIDWNDALRRDVEELARLALREDLGELGDLTSAALVPEEAEGKAAVVARQPGVIAGLSAVEAVLHVASSDLIWSPTSEDGQTVAAGDRLGEIAGPARAILGVERVLLNLVGRLSGIATLTRTYVDAAAGAAIYDTRKTTPGWRRLEKYAVRMGGGHNHRTGLFDAILIKDNHLALGAQCGGPGRFSPAEAVRRARQFVARSFSAAEALHIVVEIEVDDLGQLGEVLAERPDVVLLDNLPPSKLREAVALRRAANAAVVLEASGGVTLETVGKIAATGVDRISVGALTHSAASLDVGLDWLGNVA